MTADELEAVATELGSLAEQFRTRSTYFSADLDAANTFDGRASSAWHGNRATTNLALRATTSMP